VRRTLTPMLERYAADISRRDLRAILNSIVDRGQAREAEKRRQTVGAMFRWALSQDIVEKDPAAGLEAYDRGTPRDRVLTVEEIKTVWKWLDSDALSLEAADILKLELLIGARCGEIAGLCAEEIDRQKWIWTLPAARSKNRRARVTPIVGMAREILGSRFPDVEKGPLFLLEKGVVMTQTVYVNVRFSRSDIKRMIEEERAGRARDHLLLAESYFKEPRWPLERALAWIAYRRVEALLLRYDELQKQRWADCGVAMTWTASSVGIRSTSFWRR